jgi:hypothetical protein
MCQGIYHIDATVEHERVMSLCDSHTWMTTSVCSAIVGVIYQSSLMRGSFRLFR